MVVRGWIKILFYGITFVVVVATTRATEPGLPPDDGGSGDEAQMEILIRGYIPKKDNEYVCIAAEVSSPGYIVDFSPVVTANDNIHHMLAHGCDDPPFAPGVLWNCERKPVCKSPMKILYAWTRHAPRLTLPAGVGVAIGGGEGRVSPPYIVLQLHYGEVGGDDNAARDDEYSGVKLRVTRRKPQYLAGVYLLVSANGTIPPNTASYSINISCQFDGKAGIRPFAFRTHTHKLGRIVSAYKYDPKDREWAEPIGEAIPNWPQAFYPIKTTVIINPGDVIAAQCVYDSSARTTPTAIGSREDDEMCNFYIYYYTDAANMSIESIGAPAICSGNSRPDLFSSYPAATKKTTTSGKSDPVDEEMADGARRRQKLIGKNNGGGGYKMNHFHGTSLLGNHHRFVRSINPGGVGPPMYGVGGGNNQQQQQMMVGGYGGRGGEPVYVNTVGGGGIDVGSFGPRVEYGGGGTSHVRKKPGPGLMVDGGRVVWRPQDNPTSQNGGRYFYANDFGLGNNNNNNQPQEPGFRQQQAATTAAPGFVAVEKSNWLSPGVSFGQIAGLATDNNGNVVVLHRVDRVWNENTFDETNRFRERTSGPIMDDTVVTISPGGTVLLRWGRGLFYMPHGVFVDKHGYLWVSDVAMHQVFKFDTKKTASPTVLTLGTEFEPGVDERHFCKPAAVAVAPTDGTIFVADGYCNNRIVKFSANGAFVSAWGEAASELLPGGYPKMGSLALPHSLSIHDASKRLFVADRENARVQIFNYNGTVIDQITDAKFASTVYAASYCAEYDVVFILNGPSLRQAIDARVFVVDGTSKALIYSWRPQSGDFQRPHALAISKDCSRIFVGEIGPNKLWRFDVNSTGRHSSSLNAVGKNFADTGVKKPGTAGDAGGSGIQSLNQLLAVLTVSIAIPVLIIAAICLCIRFRKRGGFRAMNMTASYSRSKGSSSKKDGGRLPLLGGAFRDRNGFQRLSTEDVDAMDELSDESETEDMLYPVVQKNSTAPQKA